jgi:hypothetical protein
VTSSLPSSLGRFVGPTEACFNDLINQYPGLGVHRLLVEFCAMVIEAKVNDGVPMNERTQVTVRKVQSWQRGDFFAGGLELLQLRCFLALAGYDVEELAYIDGNARLLGYAIAFGFYEAADVRDRLGYAETSMNALWRVVLHDGTPESEDKKTKIRGLLTRKVRGLVAASQSDWREKIAQHLATYGAAGSEPANLRLPAPAVDPAVAVALRWQVAATIALAGPLSATPELRRAVLDATRSGQDLRELEELIRRLLSSTGE